MRPKNTIRARGTLVVAGALSITAVAPALAQTPAPAPGTTTSTPTAAPAQPGKAKTSFALRSARRTVTLGNRSLVTGRLRPGRPGRRVQLQVRAGKHWETVARDVTGRNGAWRLRYTPRGAAALTTRVAFAGDAHSRSATRRVGTVNVFRRALASWYGPGLYGGHLACGGTLTPGTLGVANKSLPCGTKVTLRHRGRTVRVPVVDRGPYVGAREFDLTSATRQALGFGGAGTVLTTR